MLEELRSFSSVHCVADGCWPARHFPPAAGPDRRDATRRVRERVGVSDRKVDQHQEKPFFNSSIITTPSLSAWRWQSAATAALPCQTLPSIMTMKSSRPKRRSSAESWRVPNARRESREVLRFGRMFSLPSRTQTWVMRGRSLVAQQNSAVFDFLHCDT